MEEIKKEFERRFVPKIIRGKTFTYDWDKEDLENWEWFTETIKAIQVQAKVKPACVNCKHLKIEGGYIYARTCLCQNPKIRLWNLTNCDIDIKEFGCTYFESKSV